MAGNRRWIFALLVASLMLAVAAAAAAQGASDGTLVFGQPLPKQIVAGQILNYDYALAQPSAVTFQALGDTTQPTITVLRDGEIVAQETNAGGALTIGLNALLDAGDYVVQVAARQQRRRADRRLCPERSADHDHDASPSPARSAARSIRARRWRCTPSRRWQNPPCSTSRAATWRVGRAHVVNTTTSVEGAQIAPGVLGARLRIPAGSDAYRRSAQRRSWQRRVHDLSRGRQHRWM
ncbi:MAG: hypothetical protein U0521_28395 [Anaerolineae bacterium]